MMSEFDFLIVVPVLRATPNLRTCLMSILTQEGNFRVHLRIQNGGESEDPFLLSEELRKSFGSKAISISYVAEPDAGPADAVSRGMLAAEAEMATWIGADDFLMPGALNAVHSFRKSFPSIRWVTGLPHVVSELGVPIPVHGPSGFYRYPAGFSRQAVAAGLHAGELNHGFIQQEGTFWEKSLWDEAGGIDTSLSVAYDFDLWCRFALHAELVELVMPLGAFRKHSGQLSEDLDSYLAEAKKIRARLQPVNPVAPLIPRPQRTLVCFWSKDSHRWELSHKEFSIIFPFKRIRVKVIGLRLLRNSTITLLRRASVNFWPLRIVILAYSTAKSLFLNRSRKRRMST